MKIGGNGEIEIFIEEDKISERVFQELIAHGYGATEDECDLIAAIVFDYLIELTVIDEIEDLEGEEG